MRVQDIGRILTKRWQILTVLLWVLMIAAGLVVFAVWNRTARINQNILAIQAEIAELEIRQQMIEQNQSEVQFEDKQLSALLSDLFGACKASQTRLGETAVLDPKDGEGYESIPISVSVRGTYNQIGRFVNRLEKANRFRIKELNLSSKDHKGLGILGKLKAEYIRL